jgi:glycerol-3-phosphate dehydrogenase
MAEGRWCNASKPIAACKPGAVTSERLGRRKAQGHLLSDLPGLHLYGDAAAVESSFDGHQHDLGYGITESMVRFAARYEYAWTVEDVPGPLVAPILDAALLRTRTSDCQTAGMEENGVDPQCDAFLSLCRQYPALPA